MIPKWANIVNNESIFGTDVLYVDNVYVSILDDIGPLLKKGDEIEVVSFIDGDPQTSNAQSIDGRLEGVLFAYLRRDRE